MAGAQISATQTRFCFCGGGTDFSNSFVNVPDCLEERREFPLLQFQISDLLLGCNKKWNF